VQHFFISIRYAVTFKLFPKDPTAFGIESMSATAPAACVSSAFFKTETPVLLFGFADAALTEEDTADDTPPIFIYLFPLCKCLR
jgi:hypothetical protein